MESKASKELIEMHVGDLLLKIEERFKISFESFKSKIQFLKTKSYYFLSKSLLQKSYLSVKMKNLK